MGLVPFWWPRQDNFSFLTGSVLERDLTWIIGTKSVVTVIPLTDCWIPAFCTAWVGGKAPGLSLPALHTVHGLLEACEGMCWIAGQPRIVLGLLLLSSSFCLWIVRLAGKREKKEKTKPHPDVAKKNGKFKMFTWCYRRKISQGMWGWEYFSWNKERRAKCSMGNTCLFNLHCADTQWRAPQYPF